MPSPIAHTAMICFALPAATGGRADTPLPITNRVAIAAALALLLVLPDFDFLIAIVGLASFNQAHGSWSHSLVWAVPAGVLFALLTRQLFPSDRRPAFLRLALVGAAALASHTIMDWMNWGFGEAHGVALFWPITDQEYKTPIPLFVGVRWSEPGVYLSHLLTLGTELVFAVLMVAIALLRAKRRRAVQAINTFEAAEG